MNNELPMLLTMLSYQDALNDVFDPQWRVNRNAYMRAAAVETAEMTDHYGYKWWKKPSVDFAQVQLEVVDIMHFYLSEISRVENDVVLAPLLLQKLWEEKERVIHFDGKNYDLDKISVLEKADLAMGLACSKRISFELYRDLMKHAGLTFSILYRQYAGKNVLNLFRQKNGDKQGTYIKIWSGREDNVYLSELMEDWKEDEGMDLLYKRLEDCYKTFALGM